MKYLDVSDPAALEVALEEAPLDTLAQVVTSGGEPLTVVRVPGGWYLPGDMAVASADVAWAGPREVALLDGFGDTPFDRADYL